MITPTAEPRRVDDFPVLRNRVDTFRPDRHQQQIIRAGFVSAHRQASDRQLIEGATALHEDLRQGARVSDALMRAHRIAKGQQPRQSRVVSKVARGRRITRLAA